MQINIRSLKMISPCLLRPDSLLSTWSEPVLLLLLYSSLKIPVLKQCQRFLSFSMFGLGPTRPRSVWLGCPVRYTVSHRFEDETGRKRGAGGQVFFFVSTHSLYRLKWALSGAALLASVAVDTSPMSVIDGTARCPLRLLLGLAPTAHHQ